MPRQLSESLEDYLEAIAELIAVEGHAHTKDIAARLDVKMPSVTGALRQLEKLNYIIYNTHYPVVLTSEGTAVADEVMRRHRVLKSFFSDILGLPLETASETACRIEHVVDENAIRRFVLFTEAIGSRDDARKLQTYLTEAMGHFDDEATRDFTVLSALVPGERARIAKAGRNIEGMKLPVAVGDEVTVEGISLDRSRFRVSVAGKMREVPVSVAENLYVVKVRQ